MTVKLSGGRSAVDAASSGDAIEATAPAGLTLVEVLQVISDPQRLTMLKVLADGAWHSCGTGAWATGLHKSTISHHIKIFREAGLLDNRQDGRNKYVRLRRDAIEQRFPGLLNGVLSNA